MRIPVGCIVIAGDDHWFAAGADIKVMVERTFVETLNASAARFWPRLAAVRTPLVAAVSGYALGGGWSSRYARHDRGLGEG